MMMNEKTPYKPPVYHPPHYLVLRLGTITAAEQVSHGTPKIASE